MTTLGEVEHLILQYREEKDNLESRINCLLEDKELFENLIDGINSKIHKLSTVKSYIDNLFCVINGIPIIKDKIVSNKYHESYNLSTKGKSAKIYRNQLDYTKWGLIVEHEEPNFIGSNFTEYEAITKALELLTNEY